MSFSILSPFHIMCSITWSAVSLTQHCCAMPHGYHMLLCNTSLITHVEHSGTTYIRIPQNAWLLTYVPQLVYIVSEWQGFSIGRNLLPLPLPPKTLTLGQGYGFSGGKRTGFCNMGRRRRTSSWHMQFSSPRSFLRRNYTIECTD